MAQAPLSNDAAQQAVNALSEADGNKVKAAAALGLSAGAFNNRVKVAQQRGLTPGGGRVDPNDPQVLRARIKTLIAEIGGLKQDELTRESIRANIINLKNATAEANPPAWISPGRGPASTPGVPTLFVSDLHWGEVVHSSQINGVNEYNLKIAHARLDMLAEAGVQLLKILDPQMRYPGIVVPLGGDMISGNIHDELAQSNELQTMPTVLDLFSKLASFLRFMADTFGRVFVPCVTGNHGRDTHKIYAKNRQHTSFDWLLYCFLAKHFERDERISFYIPDGPDAYYKVYEHRYLLTHGDQFRGGDGMIGALGPIIRGDHKKRSRNAQIDMEYDTLVMGHWHQDIFLRRLIVNGSLKGYDEYAYSNNFGFEPPTQQLWVTHPKYGITYRMPVKVDRQRTAHKTEWVSFPKAA